MPKHFFISVLMTSLLLVASCASPYGDTIFGGVTATRIDERTLRVNARGNQYTSFERVRDFVLLKAAEETIAAGYGHFQILDAREYERTSSYTTPRSSSSTTTASVYGSGNYVYGTANTNTQYYGGQTYVISRPNASAVVTMYPGRKPSNAPAGVYDAKEVIKFLGPKYMKEKKEEQEEKGGAG